MCIYIYIYIYVCVYIYIYIYVRSGQRGAERASERSGAEGRGPTRAGSKHMRTYTYIYIYNMYILLIYNVYVVTLPNPGEGNCLFHAIADSLPTRGDGRRHQSLRDDMVSYMSNESSALEQLWDGTTPRTLSEVPPCHSFREYLHLLRQPGTCTGELELVALGRLLQRPILILRQDHPPLLFGRHATTPRDQGIAIWFHLGHFEGILETIPPLIWATAWGADPRHPAWISQPLGQGQPHTADGAPLPLPRGGATSLVAPLPP